MGWAYCGKDSRGREIGYAIEAVCDHPGCNAKIDRGLSYACGGWHGEYDYFCEKYFCQEHLYYSDHPEAEKPVCKECYDYLEKERQMMKKYTVEIPIVGVMTVCGIEAETEDEAIEKALCKGYNETEDEIRWDCVENVVEGNVFCGELNTAEAKEED